MTREKEKIMVVDDEPDVLEVVKSRLVFNGFRVVTAMDGEEALEKLKQENPDLVLLDVNLPKKNGLEVLQTLREDMLLSHLPVIMLTAQGSLESKLAGIEAGADDYITKPFDSTELIARTRMILMRTSRGLDANPLTRLPGNTSIVREIRERLRDKKKASLLYFDLDRFKKFNDFCGYQRGDQAIKMFASLIVEAVKEQGESDSFVGHIGGDDFVAIVGREKAESICRTVIERFDQTALQLYDESDLPEICQGAEKEKAGLMTVSIGLVSDLSLGATHAAEVAQRGAELKAKAKALPGSRYVKG